MKKFNNSTIMRKCSGQSLERPPSQSVIPAKAGIHLQTISPIADFSCACYNQAMKQPCVYIMASKMNGTLYIGVTADLRRRAWQHRTGAIDGFTKKYNVKKLVWYELHATMPEAIKRESNIKAWKREWKTELIEAGNPDWIDLYDRLFGR